MAELVKIICHELVGGIYFLPLTFTPDFHRMILLSKAVGIVRSAIPTWIRHLIF